MRFTWNKNEIRWLLDAGSYTGFHKALAQIVVPHLEADGTLCDLGCGLGRLDLELSAHVRELTAIDINENATGVLRRDVEMLGIDNLRVRVGDTLSLTEVFDIVLMSFFGWTDMSDYLKLCRKKLIRIVSTENKSGLYPENHRCKEKVTIPVVHEELVTKGVEYKLELHSAEFGQPLVSWEEAVSFVRKNAPEATAEEIGGFLNARLERTGREDFPFYLPNQKEFGIFIIDKEE